MDDSRPINGVVYHAGFPNAAETAERLGLDVQRLLVQHPASTYFWKLGEDMADLGWRQGDIAVVDRALLPRHRDIVAAIVDETFVVRRFVSDAGKKQLQHPDGQPETDDGAAVWGVVSFVVQQARGR